MQDVLRKCLVGVLLLLRGPATIARLVVTVVVYTIDAVFRGSAKSHVGDEVIKGHPSFADLDPSAAIPEIARIRRAQASTLNACPDAAVGGSNGILIHGCAPSALATTARMSS